jgi:hypothetical protein
VTVLPLGYRGRSLHAVAPHTDARQCGLNKNQRRAIHARLTLTRTQLPAMVGGILWTLSLVGNRLFGLVIGVQI